MEKRCAKQKIYPFRLATKCKVADRKIRCFWQKDRMKLIKTTVCLILNKVDTKSLKKYGETTKREPLCEGHRSH